MTAARKVGISRKGQGTSVYSTKKDEITQQAYAAMKRGRLRLHDLSVQAVAQVRGMKAPNVYRYFAAPALDRIRACLSVAGTKELTASVQGVLDTSKGDRRVLRAVAESYVQFAEGAPEVYRLMFGTAIPEKLWEAEEVGGEGLFDAKLALFQSLERVAQRARTAGQLPEHPHQTHLLWMILHGVASMCIEKQLYHESFRMTWPELAVSILTRQGGEGPRTANRSK